MKTPTNCFTSFARINTELLDRIKIIKSFNDSYSAWEILNKIQQTQTKSILPDGWKYK